MLKNACVFAFLSSALGGSIAFEFAEPPRATSSQCCPRGFAPLGTPEGNIRVAGFAPLGTQRRQHEGAGVRTTHLPQGEYSVPCYRSTVTRRAKTEEEEDAEGVHARGGAAWA